MGCIAALHGDQSMITSERFVRFAAECEVMAKFTPNRENRMVWNQIAQRWLRCAELLDRRDADARERRKAPRSARTHS
jgi:hypothetical protein